MINKTYSTLIASVFLLSACSNESIIPESGNDGVMKFSALLDQTTRATANEFESGDRIGLFVVNYNGDVASPLQISGNHANNLAATYDGISWTTAKTIFWPTEKTDVYAYYPYQSLISVDEQPFSVALDQTTLQNNSALGGYEASDLLWCKTAGASSEDGMVSLRFRHIMSKISIRLQKGEDYDGELPDNAIVYIHNTVPEAVVDLATGTVTKDSYGTSKTITCRKVNSGLYEAIIVPQRLETRRPLIELVAGKVSYMVEDQFAFRNGTHYTVTLTLNSDPGKIDINIGGGIGGGWN